MVAQLAGLPFGCAPLGVKRGGGGADGAGMNTGGGGAGGGAIGVIKVFASNRKHTSETDHISPPPS